MMPFSSREGVDVFLPVRIVPGNDSYTLPTLLPRYSLDSSGADDVPLPPYSLEYSR